jgi:cell shape-determining protein MreD
VHDVLTGGRLGLYGFSDTLAAWIVSKVQQRMVLQQTLQIGLVGLLASAFQLAVLATLQFLMVPSGELPAVGPAALRSVLTGVLLVVVHATAERIRVLEAQWREKRRARVRFDA